MGPERARKLILPVVAALSILFVGHGWKDMVDVNDSASRMAAPFYPDITDASVNNAWKVVNKVGSIYGRLIAGGDRKFLSVDAPVDEFQALAGADEFKNATRILRGEREKWVYTNWLADQIKPWELRAGEPAAGLVGLAFVVVWTQRPRRPR